MAIVAATVIAGPGCGINGFEIGRRTPNLGADNVFARPFLWWTSMNCSTLGGLAVEGGFRRSSLRFTQSQEGFKRRHFQVQATETLSPLLVAEQKSLGELTRDDFPILNQEINGNRLVYLDNAATSQKPAAVLNALKDYYEGYNSNVHRGIHTLSAKSTDQFEIARSRIAKFINAPSHADVVFTRNATEAINLVAYTWALTNLQRGDEIVLTVAEHHSNLVPWQLVAEKVGVVLKFATLTEDESIDIEQLKGLISNRTKLVALHHVSNTLGSIIPMKDIIVWAHKYGAKVLVDACQSVPHMAVDVQDLDADFLVASSHKMCGPTGVGFLYGKSEILDRMPPWMGGGEMIADVYLEHSTYANPPARFEAGTPAIGEAIGLGAAVEYLSNIGMDRIHAYEMELSKYLYDNLSLVPDVKIYGPAPGAHGENRAALCAFNVEGMHATDIATVLDMEHGIAVRSGHHCTQPLHRHLNVNATARASLYFYNTKEEVDAFIRGLKESVEFFSSFR
ncbi:cysteine desulfurase / selenocysteine lyase [Marchantia polymorpha subsp. ruderalis]|uniref:cysteine desulfurase n=3 Tax=Marchantia polymorpha TaxID=3197 RepID=A0AAF6BLM7_MARPO|nr:hypothetical protein MARPO_0010s0063 [Marchantia polymorpha]BBN12911.1 hypothetical protein Mp_5g23930 [Marchantia polymorpha subsp. ruderalis]|eukprot:PTQ46661.1 hypothetical protein MARPO_0010s0063 [Marchantia polymorpha]